MRNIHESPPSGAVALYSNVGNDIFCILYVLLEDFVQNNPRHRIVDRHSLVLNGLVGKKGGRLGVALENTRLACLK